MKKKILYEKKINKMSYSIISIENISEVSKKDIRILDNLLTISKFSDAPDHKMAACIDYGNEVYGYNQYIRTRTRKMNAYSLHAEIHAISLFIKNIGGYDTDFKNIYKMKFPNKTTIYITRPLRTKYSDKDQLIWMGCSKPCENCEKYIKAAGISKIKYTDIIDGKQVLYTLKLNK